MQSSISSRVFAQRIRSAVSVVQISRGVLFFSTLRHHPLQQATGLLQSSMSMARDDT